MDAVPDRRAADGGPSKPPSRLRSRLILASLMVVPLAAMWLTAPRGSFAPSSQAAPWPNVLVELVGSLVVGIFFLAAAVTLYLLVVFTGCFTWDYTRPVFKRSKPWLFVANMLVLLLLMIALALLGQALLSIPFKLLGLRIRPWVVAMIASGLLVNLVSVRLNIWAPLERRQAVRRQRAAGIPERDIAMGIHVGISDPAQPAWKKAIIEDDVGMLWLEPARIVYRGDSDGFAVSRLQMKEIERVVLASSTTAYAGNRHIVLRFAQEGGGERRVRLHVEGEWSLGRIVKATDRLADRLVAWKPPPAAGDGTAAPSTAT